jgi:lysophospholipase L1-like esterase
MYVSYRPLPGERFLLTAFVQGTGDIRAGISVYSRDARNKLKYQTIWSTPLRLTGKRQTLQFAPDLSRCTAVRMGLQFELVSEGSVKFDQINLAQLKDTALKVSVDPEFAAIRPGERYPDLHYSISPRIDKVQFFPAADPASPTPVDMKPDAKGIVKVSHKAAGKGRRFVLTANGNTAVTGIEVLKNQEYNKFDTLAKSIRLKKPMRILVIGDSLLDQNFHSNADCGAVKQFAFWLKKYNPGKVTIRNAAVRGDYIERVWDRMGVELKQHSKRVFQQQEYDKLFSFPADLVFIQLGHNDTRTSSQQNYKTPLVPKEKQEKLYIRTLTAIRRAMPQCKIVLISSTSSNYELILANHERAKLRRPRGPFVLFAKPEFMEDFNAVLRKIAPQFDAAYYDIYTAMKKLPQKERAALFDLGGVHLSDEGQKYLAYQYLKFIAEYPDK